MKQTTNKIISQGFEWKCRYAAVINACEILWLTNDPQSLLDSVDDWYGAPDEIVRYLATKWINIKLRYIRHFHIKIMAKRGIPVVTWTNGYDKDSIRNEPYIMKWCDRIGAHAFIVIDYDDEEDKFICENSWWENENDHWLFYVNIADIRKLKAPFVIEAV